MYSTKYRSPNAGKSTVTRVVDAYLTAKERVINSGYAEEIDWQDRRRVEHITESDFLRQAGWVVLSSGMRETVIRNLFGQFSEAFFSWESAEKIVINRAACRRRATRCFHHFGKVNAVVEIAAQIHGCGFVVTKEKLKTQGVEYIKTLPFMGPATSFHLAKNIGIQVAKPDRHLVRVSQSLGYKTPQALCEDIAEIVGDAISTIDVVIWRYATIDNEYLRFFAH